MSRIWSSLHIKQPFWQFCNKNTLKGGGVWYEKKKKSLWNNDFIFCSGLSQGKEKPIRQVPGAKQILHHQLLGCVSKARWVYKRAQKSPEASVPSAVTGCCTSAGCSRGHQDHCQARPLWHGNPAFGSCGAAFLLPLFSPSLAPSWILNLLWLHPLYHLICFLIWSRAAMWLIKGRCELSSSQRSPCTQTNMLIYFFLPAVTFPCSLLPFLNIFIYSLRTLPLFTLSFSSFFYDLLILICLKESFLSPPHILLSFKIIKWLLPPSHPPYTWKKKKS